jgi:hypothetical protein
MKKYIFIFLLIIPFLASSQEYEPTIVEGNRWDINYVFGMGGISRFSDVLSCDTLIDNQVYTLAITYWRNEENELLSVKSRAYLREDTNNRIIYRKESLNDAEDIFIDFSLEVGDTTWNGYIIESIGTEHWFDKDRRTMHLTNGFIFIEGVGHYAFGIFWGDWYSNWNFYNVGDICDDPVSNVDLDINTEYIIYPNPTYDYVRLKFPVGYEIKSNLKVLDINGRIIQKQRIGDNLIVDLSRLQAGLYFIDINGVKKEVIKI